jgi:tetratricopeptide (TPR) repeat protein
MSESTESTQPVKIKKPARWPRILLSVLGVLVLLGVSVFGGYQLALGDRVSAAKEVVNKQLTDQFQYALVDIQLGRYEAAKQRLEYIVANDPSYPGAAQKLTEILVLMTVPTATVTPLPTPTPNPTGAEGIFTQAQALVNARDWANALVALDEVRKADPNYKAGQVDGMYYFVLRNYGFDQIVAGNLEGGIYGLTLAERFAPLDHTANALRDNARVYLIGASFWDVDWKQAAEYLSQVNGTGLWDGTMNANQRYNYAAMRYGDDLFKSNDMCAAVTQYQNVTNNGGSLDDVASKHYNQAYQICFPPTAVPTEVIPTDTPPTETPTAGP